MERGSSNSFYDVEQDVESYYWEARRLNNTEERANDAFVSLVAGCSSGEFFGTRARNGEVLSRYIHGEGDKYISHGQQLIERGQRVTEAITNEAFGRPVRDGGLVPSADGLSWVTGTGVPLGESHTLGRTRPREVRGG